MLKFSYGNAKIGAHTAIFSLPAGWSCPFARDCLSKANRETGKISDGLQTKFRCYAASGEALYSNTRKARWHNFELLKGKNAIQMYNEIIEALPTDVLAVRIHSSGDFFSQAYFDAWVMVAKENSSLVFYAYTKALPFWVARLGQIPENLHLIASWGGTHDNLIGEHYLRNARVVFSEDEANFLGLDIDHDDKLARDGKKSFSLLIHGIQRANTSAATAWNVVKKTIGGYSNKRKRGARTIVSWNT